MPKNSTPLSIALPSLRRPLFIFYPPRFPPGLRSDLPNAKRDFLRTQKPRPLINAISLPFSRPFFSAPSRFLSPAAFKEFLERGPAAFSKKGPLIRLREKAGGRFLRLLSIEGKTCGQSVLALRQNKPYIRPPFSLSDEYLSPIPPISVWSARRDFSDEKRQDSLRRIQNFPLPLRISLAVSCQL